MLPFLLPLVRVLQLNVFLNHYVLHTHKLFRVTIKPSVGAPIHSPTVSKYRVIVFHASSVCGSFCPVHIPREGTADWSQNAASNSSSSIRSASIAPILSKAFNGSGSEIEHDTLTRSHQLLREIQSLSYSVIQVWGPMWVLTDIESGKSW